MCGILAIISQKSNISEELVLSLSMLQHRGQDGAGIATLKDNNSIFEYKKKGLVSQIFSIDILKNMESSVGVGHVRYTTQGSDSELNLMPITLKKKDISEINNSLQNILKKKDISEISIVFNGNIQNISEIKEILKNKFDFIAKTESDGELLGALFLFHYEKSVIDSIKYIQTIVKGAFSVLILTNSGDIISFIDNYGFRPLFWGKKVKNGEIFYMASSETPPLDSFEYDIYKEMGAGDILFFEKNRDPIFYEGKKERQSFCVFEYLYFSRPDSIIFNQSVAEIRVECGKTLAKTAKKHNLLPDIVIDIPSSGYFAASGFSEEMNIPLKRGILQNEFMKRTFILPQQSERDAGVKQKFNIIKSIVNSKKIAVIDDSIVRGTTAKYLIKQLKLAGAKEIYLFSASPKIFNPCYYGVDIAKREELIVNYYSHDGLERYFGVEKLIFLDLDELKKIFDRNRFCFACFDGNYPILQDE